MAELVKKIWKSQITLRNQRHHSKGIAANKRNPRVSWAKGKPRFMCVRS